MDSRSRPPLPPALLVVAALLTLAAAPVSSTPITSAANIPFSGISPGGVDMATGELILVMRPDLSLDGPFPVGFGRYYASMLAREGLASSRLGPNWLGTYDWTLSVAGSNATLVTNRGAAIRFTQGPGGGWNLTSPTYASFKLDQIAGGVWRFTNPLDRHLYFFDGVTWLLNQIVDEHGNALNLTYTGGALTQVTDGLGRTLTFAYDSASGHLMQVSDGTRTVHYNYTGGVLASYVDANAHPWIYAINPGPIQGLITGIFEPMGNTPITQAYDAQGRVSSQTDALSHMAMYGYDFISGNTYTDPLSDTWTYSHDAQNRLMTLMDPLGGPTSYGYDPQGRIQMISRPMGDPTQFSYDPVSGYPSQVMLADGPSFSWTYGSHVVGGGTIFDLATANYPDGTNESYGRDASGNLNDFRDRAGFHWQGTYNGRGQILTLTNPSMGVTTYGYDPQGRQAIAQDNAGNTTHYFYDPLNRLMTVNWQDGTGQSYAYDNLDALTGLTDERSKLWSYGYDSNERLTSATDPMTETTGFGYDAVDRVTSVTDPLGHATGYQYDANGRLMTFTDRSGRQTNYQYDPLNRLKHILDPAGGGDAFGYDPDSRLTSTQDPLGHGSTFDYNFRDLVTHMIDPVGTSYDYGYDAMGRLHTATGPLGLSLTYNYDPRGLLSSFIDGSSETDFPRTPLGEVDHVHDANGNDWPYLYDKQGRLTSAADPLSRATTFEYDGLSRPFHARRADGSTVQYDYDPAGRLTGLDFLPGGLSFTYGYDDANRLTSANGASFSYDPAGRMTTSNGFGYTYDEDGRLLSETLAPGKAVSYTYNSRGLSFEVKDWSLGTTTNGYDAARRLTSTNRGRTAITYGYDNADRLTSAVESNPGPSQISSISITRDPLGRISSINRRQPLMPGATSPASVSFTYDPASQVNGAGHDLLGRTTSEGSRSFVWDGASRLTQYFAAAGADTPSFTYDAFSQILSTNRGSQTVQQAWGYGRGYPTNDDMEVNLPTRGRFFVRTPDGDLLYSMDGTSGARSYYHYDEVGNTAYLTNDTGSVVTSYAYTPYGGAAALGETSDNSFTFQSAAGFSSLGPSGLYAEGGVVYDDHTMRVISGITTGSGPVEVNPGPVGSPENEVGIVPPWPWKNPGPGGSPAWRAPGPPNFGWKGPGPPGLGWKSPGPAGFGSKDPGPQGSPAWRDPGPPGFPGWKQPGPGGSPAWKNPGPPGSPSWKDPGPPGLPGLKQPGPTGSPAWRNPGPGGSPAWRQPGPNGAPTWDMAGGGPTQSPSLGIAGPGPSSLGMSGPGPQQSPSLGMAGPGPSSLGMAGPGPLQLEEAWGMCGPGPAQSPSLGMVGPGPSQLEEAWGMCGPGPTSTPNWAGPGPQSDMGPASTPNWVGPGPQSDMGPGLWCP